MWEFSGSNLAQAIPVWMCVVLWMAEDLSSSECRRRPQTLTCWSCRCAVPRSDLTARKWLGPADTRNSTVSFVRAAHTAPHFHGGCSRWKLKQHHRAFMAANGTWKRVEWTLSCTWALVCHLSPLRSMPNSILASLQTCLLPQRAKSRIPCSEKHQFLCAMSQTHVA